MNCKVAPRPALALAHKRPPCDSIIFRLIDNPMPVPCGLVVKKASKIRSARSGAIPIPESLTEISNSPSAVLFEVTVNSPPVSFIASIPLSILTEYFRLTPETWGKDVHHGSYEWLALRKASAT